MPVVSLKKILDAFDFLSDEHKSYLNPADGEVITIADEDRDLVESDDPIDDLPDWHRQSIASLRSLDLDSLLKLPDKFDIHEWDIMRRFARSLPRSDQSDALLDSIHGSGAFRSFKRELDRLDLRDAWFAYKRAALLQVARDWLDHRDLQYIEDAG